MAEKRIAAPGVNGAATAQNGTLEHPDHSHPVADGQFVFAAADMDTQITAGRETTRPRPRGYIEAVERRRVAYLLAAPGGGA